MKHLSIGCHVFAGGFSMGVRQRMQVLGQLEIHDFGRETVEKIELPFINRESWEDWPRDTHARLVFGNPRCTGFSTTTSGYDDTIHGPFAKCTCDIHDMCKYAIREDVDLVCWESVQQASSVGRPLLDYLRDEYFVPAGYRIAHLFINAATFGNAQHRKRYFFMAYRGGNFNIRPPTLLDRHSTVRDKIGRLMAEGVPGRLGSKNAEYGDDHYQEADAETQKVIPHLLPGECLNQMGKHRPDALAISAKLRDTWDDRWSPMPFSLHCHRRLAWDRACPTLASSCAAFVHPELPRPLTVQELSLLMGWPEGVIPSGPRPMAQIAKGICPEVGVWLAEQAIAFLDGDWGSEDWESSYDPQARRWYGRDYTNDRDKPVEKTFNMTSYCPARPGKEVTYDAV